ncbi:hypothetical protein ACFX5L_09320 [Bacteroides sp. KG123]|uniref:hypothetical protein n=1 Tax=Bacteroides TaxID=816 RepID=UPI003AF1280E
MRYEIERELNSLYAELEAAEANDAKTVRLMYNVDEKAEAIALIKDDIKALEDQLSEYGCSDDGMDYAVLQLSQGLAVYMPGRM